ncbi:probable small nuclear ribonucleoprotein G [Punica granatum]|uniref:Sm protein G n=1 Tax=Punica granatum TaxID=22663 RepID=A0A6P8C1V1_PUNGR|nr:probable small nuclear ribonucleoprotein G [Punica granatum]
MLVGDRCGWGLYRLRDVRFEKVLRFSECTRIWLSRIHRDENMRSASRSQEAIKFNANRMVVGTLCGFDQFMNLVAENTIEVSRKERNDMSTSGYSRKQCGYCGGS